MLWFDYDYKTKSGKKILSSKGRVHFVNLPKDYKEFQKRMGLVIAYVREYKGINQKEATRATGINFFETELGLREMNFKALWKVAELLNTHSIALIAFACCGDGEWTEEKMKTMIQKYKKANKAERKRQRREKNKKESKK
ncbi:MAG: hypothetical protein HY841_03560 [Bacteroidetes bacterium]|nr:hypothetical protein [Bacteroidota bacterium]